MPEDTADIRIVDFLQRNGYHPRSSAHGDAICRFVLDDLMAHCQAFRSFAVAGRIVYEVNYSVGRGEQLSWNVDLVVGPPTSLQGSLQDQPAGLRRGEPSEIWIAVDAKSVMTEHGKARRNRQRDLNSLHDIMHRKNPRTIVGGLIVVNLADRFQSPLRTTGPTIHHNIERLVKETVQMYEDLPRRATESQQGLDAVGVIVVNHSNVQGDRTMLVTNVPAPPVGSPVRYESFLADVCRAFVERFAMELR